MVELAVFVEADGAKGTGVVCFEPLGKLGSVDGVVVGGCAAYRRRGLDGVGGGGGVGGVGAVAVVSGVGLGLLLYEGV